MIKPGRADSSMHPVMQLGIEKSRAEETRILPVKRGETRPN